MDEDTCQSSSIRDHTLRRVTKWVTLVGTMGLAVYGFAFVIAQTLNPTDPASNWIVAVLRDHYAATLGVPMSAVAALCIVLVLESATGPIEIATPWIKFRGASGPVILWILSFLSMVTALRVLWL